MDFGERLANPRFLVTHHLVERQRTLLDFLFEELNIAPHKGENLLSMGAIYVNKKRCLVDTILAARDYVRIHHEPKRFKMNNISWKNLIVDNTKAWVIVNKPPGLPVHPTLDNYKENLWYQLTQLLQQELFVTHRLDVDTSGLLVFAKNRSKQTHFNELLNQGSVKKYYTSLNPRPIKANEYTHYMKKSRRAPKQLYAEPTANTKICKLKILGCQSFVEKGKQRKSYRHEIQLITGRTHQIRAQCQFLQSPILGDHLYGCEHDFYPGIALCCHGISWDSHKYEIDPNFS